MKVDATRNGSPSTFAHDVAVRFAHASMALRAVSLDIRALSIKGPIADHYRLRPRRTSADADILIDPTDYLRFCDSMRESGWHERIARDVPGFFGPHSTTLIHDSWPCDIDVHWRFPGFFADPSETFEALWEGRTLVRLAGADVVAPSRAGSAVIAALHSERSAQSLRGATERRHMIERVTAEFCPKERSEMYALIQRGRATWVLRDVVEELALGEAVMDATPIERRAWLSARANAEHGAAATWLLAIRMAPLRRKLSLVWRALWVDRKDVPRNDANAIPTTRETWLYRVDRWKRGAKTLLGL